MLNVFTVSICIYIIIAIISYSSKWEDKDNRAPCGLFVIPTMIMLPLTLITICIGDCILIEHVQLPYEYDLVAIKSKDTDKTTTYQGFFVTSYTKDEVRYYSMFIEYPDGIQTKNYKMDDDSIFIKESDRAFVQEYWRFSKRKLWAQKFFLMPEYENDGHWREPAKVIINVPKGSILREFNVSL